MRRLALKVMLAFALVGVLAGVFVAQVLVAEVKPGVRQAMEANLVNTANLLAELAAADMAAGTIGQGAFAEAVARAVRRDPQAAIWRFPKRAIELEVRIADARGTVVYDSSGRHLGQDHARWNDVLLTLRGQYGVRSSPVDPADPDGPSAMHVAAPVRDARGQLLGVLTVIQPNASFDPYIHAAGEQVVRKGLWLAALCILVGGGFSAWLAWRIGRLRRYAEAITRGATAIQPEASFDEIGQLGRALATMRAQLDGKAYVEQYVQTLTHEMKSPLAAINASAELLAAPMPEADRARFAASIGEQGARLAQMIDRLLALATLEQQQVLPERHALDFAALVSTVVADSQGRAQQRGLSLVAEVPATAELVGDGFFLRQAVANLVDNALDFAAAGPVQVRLAAADGGWCLQVLDDGPGVADYAQARIFERFYSTARPRNGQRSSGLGLNLVAEVARLHGGRVALLNREQGGACASLWLPRR